jgi:hypothetical protein
MSMTPDEPLTPWVDPIVAEFELRVNGSSQPSTATSTPCASNCALARQPLEEFRFGTLPAHCGRRQGKRSAFGLQQRN